MRTVEEKLYQLIISRLNGEDISSPLHRQQVFDLVEKGIGGFIVFGGEKQEIRPFIDALQSAAAVPLFIASDIERGVGQQIRGATHFPGQMALAAAIGRISPGDKNLLEGSAAAIAREAIDAGINMPLIPVLDVNTNPDNPIICTRAFSDDPGKVTRYGKKYITILQRAGLISCAKHFPGHGDTAVDSHISLPVIAKPFSRLAESDLLPFAAAIRAGVSAIMAGHLSIPAADTLPASLSRKLITHLLRQEMGFSGLVLTDALNMHALDHYGHVPVLCINAGVDILLHPADVHEIVRELTRAIEIGELNEKVVDKAVERILTYKGKIKSLRRTAVDYDEHGKLSSLISDRSITLVRCREGLLPLKEPLRAHLVIAADENRHDPSVIGHLTSTASRLEDMGEYFGGQTIIVALFTSVAAWQGTSGIGEEAVKKIGKIIRKVSSSIVISFGSPYVLRHFPDADALIAAYEPSLQSQRSVVQCLTGKQEFEGTLPVALQMT
ncbi:MAG: hypothetical protein JSU90_06430 [Nitrospiraceae bacterium]|nr:MAG: hypothetical protein JSU90_06430 [Nitrospiraceae bacterium]